MSAVVPIRPDVLSRIMLDPGASGRAPFDPRARGFALLYRGGETSCPACGRSHWLVGRSMAECAFCATALPLERKMK